MAYVAALGLAAFFAVCLYALFRARGTDVAVQRANRKLQDARYATAEDAAQLLAECCAECEKLADRSPRDVFILQIWGAALWMRGKAAPDEAADGFFAGAEERFAAALEIRPDDIPISVNRFWALLDRAARHPGVLGKHYLEQIGEECERLLILKPDTPALLRFWGGSLCCLGTRTAWPEADRLYREAEEKLLAVLAITPDDPDVMSSLSNVSWRRSKERDGDEAKAFLLRSSEWLDKALVARPSDAFALSSRAWVLFLRTKLLPGEETNRLLAEAVDRFAAAAETADAYRLRQGWGVVLWAQARCAEGEESRRLLEAAREKLAAAEAYEPRSAAYNLACVCAQLGELSKCREWLEKSGEPGILVSREQMAKEDELAGVRECAWFREMLG